jgi:hypothetical protein
LKPAEFKTKLARTQFAAARHDFCHREDYHAEFNGFMQQRTIRSLRQRHLFGNQNNWCYKSLV